MSAVQQLPNNQQSLTGGSIQQNETHTILRYTQPLEGDGLLPISLTEATKFVYAAGGDNDIKTFHSINRRASFTVSQCAVVGEDPPPDDEIDVVIEGGAAADIDAWKLHGYIMAISWGVFIPLGIGASLCRNLFPQGIFFRIHQVLNSLAVIGTMVGFGIAVININKEEDVHFEIPHMKAGLAVFTLAILQAGIGFFRPHLPHPSKDGSPTPPKSSIRTYWEYKHRILGTAILLTAWYACHTGIQQFAIKFLENDEEELTAFRKWKAPAPDNSDGKACKPNGLEWFP